MALELQIPPNLTPEQEQELKENFNADIAHKKNIDKKKPIPHHA